MAALWPTDSATSAVMRKIRRSGTTPERRVRSILRRMQVNFSVTPATIAGKPDLFNRRAKWAIFVHGCFWHGHSGCHRAWIPRRNREAWELKFLRNQKRDRRVVRALRSEGYRVLIIWECQTKNPEKLEGRLRRFVEPRG